MSGVELVAKIPTSSSAIYKNMGLCIYLVLNELFAV